MSTPTLLSTAMLLTLGWCACLMAQTPATQAPAPGSTESKPVTRLLWEAGAPGALGEQDADKPSITIYTPEKSETPRAAVVVCPGGGYGHLAMDHEGLQIAQWFNARGVTAVVLKYRLGPRYHHPAPLQDVQRAIRTVRHDAATLGVDPKLIGVMGFSAGGHLASCAATLFDAGDASAADLVDRESSRPDFAVLCYPVIDLSSAVAHAGSRRNLLGDKPDPELVQSLSTQTRVTPQTPPTFLFHTNSDKGVPPENSVMFYMALRKAGVPAEMHIYQNGPHGVGLGTKDRVLATWPARLEDWLKGLKVIR